MDSPSRYLGIMDLPNEIQILILQKLSYQQLLQLKKVSKHFSSLIESESSTLIKGVTLQNTFPNLNTMTALQWLSLKGNLEATVKLAIGHLYYEGLTDTANDRKQSSLTAAKYFCKIEQNSQLRSPITWVFIRPPWSSAAVCRKALVFKYLMSSIEEGNNHPHLLYSIGKVLKMFEGDSEKRHSARQWLQRAADKGLPDAMYELWCMELSDLDILSSIESLFSTRSPGLRLCMIRKLREIATTGYKPAQIQLCRLYASCHFGGIPSYTASKYVREIFSKSYPTELRRMFRVQSCLKPTMRYILVDWLVEVATMKDFGSEMLHATIKCVDTYLLLRDVSRSSLQLLGIACMVICTRAMEKDLLTIREAVWLTDNTYKYDELVRMMEDVVAALRGNIKEITVHDFLTILLNMNEMDKKSQAIARFIIDASLLHVDTASLSPALTASASIIIANLTTNSTNPLSMKMMQYTGFTEKELAPIALAIHENCLSEEPPTDHRNMKLDAVEERYSQCLYGPILRSQIVSYEKLASFFESSTVVEAETSPMKNICATCCCSYQPENVLNLSSKCNQTSGMQDNSAEGAASSKPFDVEWATTDHRDSDDDELDTDTPPTFSCVYLVKPDSKTRKRIRENNCIRNENNQLTVSNILPLKSSENTVQNSVTKVFQRKVNVLKSIDQTKHWPLKEKDNKLIPEAKQFISHKLLSTASENVCPEKLAKVSKEERTSLKQTSMSRHSRSPMRM